MNAISAICLLVLASICVAGVFSHMYRDNWLQFVGLCGLTAWALARFLQVLDGAHVSPQQVFAHVSIACFALGSAHKVVAWNWLPTKACRGVRLLRRLLGLHKP
jgi:hypothetical protein